MIARKSIQGRQLQRLEDVSVKLSWARSTVGGSRLKFNLSSVDPTYRRDSLDGVQVEGGVARLSSTSVELCLSNLLEWFLKLRDGYLLLLLLLLVDLACCVLARRRYLARGGDGCAGRTGASLWVQQGALTSCLSGGLCGAQLGVWGWLSLPVDCESQVRLAGVAQL